ncbi:hypothetical protein LSCM1_03638 [Leishmania martiniquensis]|uniref:Uncharacterized protein n=1 Tax=Leishmania martiniquensis TaxID=1580590 RepID=A0A836H8C3_9TRYP|nr:hypothetical protein LSCM1_03638 [Leishmania martiniquensis]
MKATVGAPAAAAVPADAKCLNASRRLTGCVDLRTYRYLEEVWASALRQAEAAVLASPHTGRSDAPEATHAMEADRVRGEEAAGGDMAGQTKFSSTCEGDDLQWSPLPHAPVPRSGFSAHPLPPPAAAATGGPMPSATGTQTWMQVEAQPNLKRNAYTAHRGVAWVVR